MKCFNNILVSTDTRIDNQNIVAEAAKLAKGNDASLKLVDVVPPLPWTVRLLVRDHEHMSGLMIREKHELVMRVAKGSDSRRKGYFGTTGTRLLRECPKSTTSR